MSLVSADWLSAHIEDPAIRVLDVRWYLTDHAQGAREYADSHLPGAIFFDLETELSDLSVEGEGRHPLPDLDTLAGALGSAGIGDDHTVVVYDAGPGAIAARAWWLLRHMGHPSVHVLDGGMTAWRAIGGPETDETPDHATATMTVHERTGDTVTMDEVASFSGGVLLDARAPERFRGEVEPADPVAGHIPGAINLPFLDLVDANERFLSPEALRNHFTEVGIDTETEVIASCGSGVTACHLILSAVVAGLPEPRLYPGSYSQWCRAGMPVEP